MRYGHSVRILDNVSSGSLTHRPDGAELVVGDVADPDTVASAMRGVDGCFHLAAVASVELTRVDWLGTHRTNLTGTIAVLDAARRARRGASIPVVYASSAAVYGDDTRVPLAETAGRRPLSAYGADKLACEHQAFVAGRVHGVPTCGLRFFNVYGPRQDPTSPYSGVVSIFCDRLRAGQDVVVYGDGGQTRDFIFVADVVRALAAAMGSASTEGPVYNVCTGYGTSVLELGAAIAEVLGVSFAPRFAPPRPGDIYRSVGDPSRAKSGLGFEAQTDIRAGLAATLESGEFTGTPERDAVHSGAGALAAYR
jgi:UDP-glucose 4-epimerase